MDPGKFSQKRSICIFIDSNDAANYKVSANDLSLPVGVNL